MIIFQMNTKNNTCSGELLKFKVSEYLCRFIKLQEIAKPRHVNSYGIAVERLA
jgi:hypothetical protein